MKQLAAFVIALFFSTTLLTQAAPVSWDFTAGVLQPLKSAWSATVKVPSITATSSATNTLPVLAVPTRLSFGGVIGTAWSDFCTAITGGAGLCDGNDATGAGGGLATTSPFTNGNLAYVTGPGSVGSVATGTLTETVSGLQFDATRALVGGSAVLSLTSGFEVPTTASTSEWRAAYASTTALTPAYIRGLWSESVTGLDYASGVLSLTAGYNIPLTASTTNWNTAFNWGNHASAGYLTAVPTTTVRNMFSASSPITYTAGTGAFTFSTAGDWTGTFDGTEGTAYLSRANHTGTQLASTISDFTTTARGLFSNTATGLTYTSGTGVTSMTAGYNIPLTASTTNWESFYLTPSTRITAGTGCSWAGNTLNCPGTGGGGGGGALSTSTDSYTSSQTISYVDTTFYVGGSSSTTAEFKVNIEKGYIETSSSTNTTASSSWVNVNEAGAGEFGWGSSTGNGVVTRGIGWDVKSSSTALTWYSVGPITRMVLNMGIGFNGAVYDVYGSPGAVGSVLVSTGTSTYWLATSSLGISGGSSVSTEYASSTIPTAGWRSKLQVYSRSEDLGYNYTSELGSTTVFTDSIKPLWVGISAAGAYELYTASSSNPWGYSTATQATFEARSGQKVMPFVSDSYAGSGGAKTMIEATTTRTTWITNVVNDSVTYDWRGITFDIEGFGSWTSTMNNHYKVFIQQACDALHAQGKICQVYLPPLWNSTTTPSESGTGDEWDTRNSTGYYPLTYQEYDALGVDFIEIPLYDYEFDLGSEAPEAPLRWITDVANFAKSKIGDDSKIVIGISAQGHYGTSGYGDFNNWTYEQASATSTFSSAIRDNASGELFWTCTGSKNCWIPDNVTMDLRRSVIEAAGIEYVSVWYLGNGQYGNTPDTILELHRVGIGTTTVTDTSLSVVGEISKSIARFFGSTGSSTAEISHATTTVRHSSSLSGFLQASLARLTVGIEHAIGYYRSGRLFGALTIKGLFFQEEWNQVDCSSLVGATQISADGLTGCDGFAFYEDGTGTLTSTANGGMVYGRLGTSATADGAGVFLNAPTNGFLIMATSTPVFEATARIHSVQNQGTTTQTFIGFTNIATAGTTYETAPTAGCFFTASTTQANWRAICRTSLAAQTNVDTGIASSTVTTGDGVPYRFMIEADTTGAKFYMQTIEAGNLNQVASITTNVPTTTAMNAGVHFGRAQGVTSIGVDVYDMNVGWRKMLAR